MKHSPITDFVLFPCKAFVGPENKENTNDKIVSVDAIHILYEPYDVVVMLVDLAMCGGLGEGCERKVQDS